MMCMFFLNIPNLDGGLYRGEMRNGRITGSGEYESAFGEIMKGEFFNGLLHGDGTVKNYSGEEFIGKWKHGALNFLGTYKNMYGDEYIGAFRNSMRHGRGFFKIKSLGEYKGFWINGTRTGKAELDFLPRVEQDGTIKELSDVEQRSGHEFKHRYQGYFMCDHILNGGIMMDTLMQVPYAVSMRSKKSQKALMKFEYKWNDSLRKINRRNTKMSALEIHMRNDIEGKKMKIYRQQKHYTKKAMYEEDMEGMDHHELIQRRNARKSALDRLDEKTLKSSKALIPRLQIIEPTPTVYLSKALQAIERNRENPINPDDSEQLDKALLQNLTISNFEEAVERQRFLKYDRIWGRAEKAFAEKRKKAAAEAAEQQNS
jgi:hypothetical protein